MRTPSRSPGYFLCTHVHVEGSEVRSAIDFDLRDEKGRAVGVKTYRAEAHVLDVDSGYSISKDEDFGVWFEAVVSPTRDGVSFGGSKARERFRTAAEADAYIAKSVASSRKRYAKKYGVSAEAEAADDDRVRVALARAHRAVTADRVASRKVVR